jgi:hypothetical protein
VVASSRIRSVAAPSGNGRASFTRVQTLSVAYATAPVVTDVSTEPPPSSASSTTVPVSSARTLARANVTSAVPYGSVIACSCLISLDENGPPWA